MNNERNHLYTELLDGNVQFKDLTGKQIDILLHDFDEDYQPDFYSDYWQDLIAEHERRKRRDEFRFVEFKGDFYEETTD